MSNPPSMLKKLSGWLAGWRTPVRPSTNPYLELPVILQQVRQALDQVTKSSEGEFLAIGEQLHTFYASSETISGLSQAVARSISGTQTAQIISDFQSIVQQIRDLETASNQSSQAMQHLITILATLRQELEGFQNIVRSLRMLCISIRIQSARVSLEDIGFSTLADDVGHLAEEVEDRCTRLLRQTDDLTQMMNSALMRARDLESRQKAQVQQILGDTSRSLEGITVRHQRSSEGAGILAERYRAIGQRIGNIVMSLQIHDIIRQRVEHVQEALDKLLVKLTPHHQAEATASPTTRNVSGRSPWEGLLNRLGFRRAAFNPKLLMQAGVVSELQIAQLGHARTDLVSEVENVMANLRGVGELMADIVLETQKINGAARDEDGQSALTDLESGFASITTALTSYNTANQELATVTASVGDTLQQMTGFSRDIEDIGIRIKLIALNAIIKAEHFGAEGATLSVLAEAIHDLSVNTCQRTEMVSQEIGTIMSSSDGMATADQRKGGAHGNVGTALEHLMDSLKATNFQVTTQLAQVDAQGNALAQKINATIEGVTVHHTVTEAINQAVTDLKRIIGLAHHHCQNYNEEAARLDLVRDLESAYTMQQERAVHHSIAAGGAVAAGAAVIAAATPSQPSDDDIELFDNFESSDTSAAVPESHPETGSERSSGIGVSAAEDLADDILLFDDVPASPTAAGSENLNDDIVLFDDAPASPTAAGSKNLNDDIVLFDDAPASPAAAGSENLNDDIVLFDDAPASPAAAGSENLDDDIILFDQSVADSDTNPSKKSPSDKEDFGDNVELF